MAEQICAKWDSELRDLLGLSIPPIAIRFLDSPAEGVPAFDRPMPAPTADGRTGRVPAGCVFWMHGTSRTFSTVAEDHGNCSVGSYTHGFKKLAEAAPHADIAALVEAGWVTPDMFPHIPAVAERPASIVYGPLREAEDEPDVVFLRINGKQQMTLVDAWPEVQFEGKPQCHVIPIAKEQRRVAISVGCMLSRVRTGMSNNEVTCAIPGGKVGTLIERLRAAQAADRAVAIYAAEDSRRFQG